MITKIHSSSSKIASVLDPFSFASFANEAHLVQVRPDHITAQLSSINPDFLFVESAWHGVDDLWFGKICEPSPELLELISLCKERSIPTVFWCKEDPIHFDRFLLTASLFDYIFTTDINRIPLYKQALAHSRVGLLPFACQPLAHNPVENFPRKDAISYAGSFYRRFPDRVTDTDNILGIASQIRSLDIFDRYFDSEDENYRFPERYEQFIRGSLPPDQVDLSYKAYRYGINLNTVKNSESMFARRAIELLASGTMIISNSSPAFPLLFGDVIIANDDPHAIQSRLNAVVDDQLLRAKLVAIGIRKAMQEHTYSHRLATIEQKVFGASRPPRLPAVLVLIEIKELADLNHILLALYCQNFQNWRALVICNSELSSQIEKMELDPRIRVLIFDEIGELQLSSLVQGETWVTLMSVRDYYGPNYVMDMILATRYSNASAFGKKQFFQVVDNSIDLQGSEGAYRSMTTMELRSSLISAEHFSGLTISRLFSDDAISSIEVSDGMALDYLGYCRNVFNQNKVSVEEVSAIVDDLEINQGSSIDELYAKADALKMAVPFWLGKPGWKPEKLALIFGDRFTRDITGSVDRFGWHIISELPDGETCDLFSEFAVPIEDLGGKSGIPFYMEAGVGLQMQLLVRFELSSGALLDEVVFEVNTQNQLTPPDSCTHIRLGYRITSSGSSRITRLVLA